MYFVCIALKMHFDDKHDNFDLHFIFLNRIEKTKLLSFNISLPWFYQQCLILVLSFSVQLTATTTKRGILVSIFKLNLIRNSRKNWQIEDHATNKNRKYNLIYINSSIVDVFEKRIHWKSLAYIKSLRYYSISYIITSSQFFLII